LQQADIRVLEDGVPQDVFTFQKQVDLPLSLAIVIDTSGSQERTLPEEKAAAQAFVNSVLRQRKDEAAVLTFTGETTLEQSLTGNTARVRSAIERVRFIPASGVVNGQIVGTPPISGTSQAIAGSTALWDAVWVTAKDVLTDAPPRTRRAIVLLTDGVNTYGQFKLADAVAQAVKSEVSVYAIGIGDDFNYGGVDEGSLRKITERTGGRAYFPRSAEELDQAFKQIERELREQYLVAYSPKNKTRDNRFREVKIEVVNPELVKQKMKLTYRPGYFRRPADAVGGAAGAR
jgi:VWFA-related protein